LFQRSAYYIAFQRDVTKTCKLLPPPPLRASLIVYSEQVKWRRSPNEDTLQYFHSFRGKHRYRHCNFGIACLPVSRRVLCNIHSHTGTRMLPCLLLVFSIRWESCSSSEHDRFITVPYARNLGCLVRVNYSELHNGVNQAHGQTYSHQWQVTTASSLQRRRTESETRTPELTRLSIHFGWTFTTMNLNILHRKKISMNFINSSPQGCGVGTQKLRLRLHDSDSTMLVALL
jgi:hypothetical protein